MELVVGLYATIALIVYILHEYVNEKVGYGARTHFSFWLDLILELIFIGFWLLTPIFAINLDRVTNVDLFGWLFSISSIDWVSATIGAIAVFGFMIGWWLFPIMLTVVVSSSKINVLDKLPPAERRLGVNIYRATFISDNSKSIEKKKEIPKWCDEKDDPSKEIFIGKKPLRVIETEEEAATFLKLVAEEKESYSYLYIDDCSTPLEIALHKMNKAKNRAIARMVTITVFIIILFFVLRAHCS